MNAHSRIFIFDWDDTIIPSIELEYAHNMSNEFRQLSNLLKTIFMMALRYSKHIYILTNAETGWVYRSTNEYIPDFRSFLDHDRITIMERKSKKEFLSDYDEQNQSRGRYLYNKTYHQFKIDTLQKIITNDPLISEVIGFGDQDSDRLALKSILKVKSDIVIKTMKMYECPTIEKLIDEWILIRDSFKDLCDDNQKLDIMVK